MSSYLENDRVKGEQEVIAYTRTPTGSDPDLLSQQSEHQARVRRQVGNMVSPMDYEPGDQLSAPPPPRPALEISSIEWEMAREARASGRKQDAVSSLYDFSDCIGENPKALNFVDLEK